MTVSEYIERLKELPQDLEVMVRDHGCGCCGSGEVYSANEPMVCGAKKNFWSDGKNFWLERDGNGDVRYVEVG